MRLPWTRAPRAALASVSTVLVAALAGLVLAFVVTAAISHTVASGSAAVAYQTGRGCPMIVTPTLDGERLHPSQVEQAVRTGAEAAARNGFDGVLAGRYTAVARMDFNGKTPWLRLGHREGAADHVKVISGGERSGLWLPRSIAEAGAVKLGDRGLSGLLPPVTTIFEDVAAPSGNWWCSEERYVVANPLAGEGRTAALGFLPDRAEFDQLMTRMPAHYTVTLRFPHQLPTTLSEAHELSRRSTALLNDMNGLGGQFTRSELLRRGIELSEQARTSVLLAVLPLTAVTVLVGMVAVGAVAIQWCQRRRAEVRLLWVRGVSPAALGGKAVLELVVPFVLGGAAGVGLGRLALPLFAPSTALEPGTFGLTAAIVAAVLGVAVLVVGATTAVHVRHTFQAKPRNRRVLRWIPWEMGTSALAVWSWTRLLNGALTVQRGEVLPRIDPIALAFPLLVVLTAAGLISRVLGVSLGASHRLHVWSWPSVQLAVRRLAISRTTATGVLTVAALAVGTVAVGYGVASAQQNALDDKSGMIVGANTAVQLPLAVAEGKVRIPEELRSTTTLVGDAPGLVNGNQVRVLVVDRASFERVAWSLSSTDIGNALTKLGPRDASGTAPALRVGTTPEGQWEPVNGVKLRTVASVPQFPGFGVDKGYVIAREALPNAYDAAAWRLWSTSTDINQFTARLTAGGIRYFNPQSRTKVIDALPFYVVGWTFSFITALGAVLAVLAACSLLLSVEVRRRQNALFTALATRMGLRRRTLVSSHLVELGVIAALATVVGTATGVISAALSAARLDPAPRLAPLPAVPNPVPFVLLTTLAAAAVVVLAGAIAVRAARTARAGELLRG
ncbi:FtsX-like permease family protein [Allokutzneria albata]|uniref:Putative ABC transport system permease protein n=1 Tax=Allokutzneria albata TaxID=211114 RepID=A0A1G9RCV6_ALLAB|nr:FtsX-like permease family protein [Allokutzneria albata]SDM21054.1 putative ABC transport system permease protein [Allokutzneria albata]